MPDRQERDHFARRAAELRTMAQDATDDEIRGTLEAMAVSYEELVEAADRAARIRRASQLPAQGGVATNWDIKPVGVPPD